MSLTKNQLIRALESFAPLELAGDWDNVGILLAPDDGEVCVSGVMCTIDLRESVLEEAIAANANLIVSYHPILFGGVKRLSMHRYSDRVVLRAIQRGITVFSPHTALDAVEGGVTDWLLNCVGSMKSASAIHPIDQTSKTGMGRVGNLSQSTPLTDIIKRLKQTLSLDHLRIATAHGASLESIHVKRVAVCPGAGGSVVAGAKGHDLVVTGEMRHHDVLSLQSRGISTILTEHTNCERGYLPTLVGWIGDSFPGLNVQIAASDLDPLKTI